MSDPLQTGKLSGYTAMKKVKYWVKQNLPSPTECAFEYDVRFKEAFPKVDIYVVLHPLLQRMGYFIMRGPSRGGFIYKPIEI